MNKGPIRVTFSRFYFFLKIMLENGGCGLYTSAAFTRVFTVASLQYGNCNCFGFAC